ncbi:hypothetical protein C8Q73DRAFT_788885 [Cubamyces lactineus]|nr:hypothetical protein C8Q73DRAFT_788885 [Cubamyces lactineus]
MSTSSNLPAPSGPSATEAQSPRPIDHEFVQKLLHHERCVRDIADQWPFKFPWSDSVGIDPKVLMGPAERSISPGKENRPPGRARKTRSARINADQAGYTPSTTVDAGVLTQAPGLKQRSNGELNAQPFTDSPTPGPSTRATTPFVNEGEPTNDPEPDPEEDLVECYIGDCDSRILRKDCKKHMRGQHMHELGPHGHGPRPCRWADCETVASDFNVMERHYQTVHYKYMAFICAICGERLSRSDALKRHERTHGQ